MGVHARTIRDEVHGYIVNGIRKGLYPTDSRIPSVAKLTAFFQSSPTPIQQAVERLEAEGWLVRKHGSGTYVNAERPLAHLDQMVAVCMEAKGHVFGDFTSLLSQGLSRMGMSP